MKLEEIKGIGPKNQILLKKLGIETSEDFLTYYPFRYQVMCRSNLESLEQDQAIIMDGTVENNASVFRFRPRMDKMTFRINTGSKLMNVTIYNRGFLKNKIVAGTPVTVIGKYDLKHNTIVASDLRFSLLPSQTQIEPVYHLTYGMSSKQFLTYVGQAFQLEHKVVDYIPTSLQEQYHFLSKEESIQQLHFPKDELFLKQARLRTKYEEFFLFMLKMEHLKGEKELQYGLARTIKEEVLDDFISFLPFSLTPDQKSVMQDIYHDLVSPIRMNRLIQGDVGSGKTVVAFSAIYFNYLSGYQSAFMAPTEILALQHFENIQKLFQNTDIKIGLLTGKQKAKEKREMLKKIAAGEVDVVVGTHALIQNDVVYQNLGLVITDEQHRFGVNQRTNLKNKGITPDVLTMSATPIPRTYALTVYGDMDVSNIKTMPSGRKKITTYLKKEKEIRDVLEMMFEELKKGHQIYVIAPLIEESDKIDLENVQKLEEKMKLAFGKLYQIGVLHGKMSGSEKDTVMNQFKQNETQILISTTVIEVGVDVPNATMIVIFDSYRFGLSTLHQLRGRVGRNQLDSYCILISNREAERLKILTTVSDGFEISEEDFRLRGSGDLFGMKQSGDMVFQLADIKKDYKILVKAKEDCEAFVNSENYETYLKETKFDRLLDQLKKLD